MKKIVASAVVAFGVLWMSLALMATTVPAAQTRCVEDDPCWTWSTMGDLERGVKLKDGSRQVVDASVFCRLERKRLIDWRQTPRLKGDWLARTRGCDGRLFAQPAR